MTKFSLLSESTNQGKRLTVSEMEDYFLEFIDSGDIEYYNSGVPIGETTVQTCWKLNGFHNITDSNKLNRLSNIIKSIGNICDRWNIKFKFELAGIGKKPWSATTIQTQFLIIQDVPKPIINFFSPNGEITTRIIKINIENKIINIYPSLNQDKDINFYLNCKTYNISEKYDDKIIEEIKKINLPLNFIGKKEDKKEDKFIFKILL